MNIWGILYIIECIIENHRHFVRTDLFFQLIESVKHGINRCISDANTVYDIFEPLYDVDTNRGMSANFEPAGQVGLLMSKSREFLPPHAPQADATACSALVLQD